MEIITIRKTEQSGKNGIKFDSYKINRDGKAVDLSLRQDSADVKQIPYGVSKINVVRLEPSKTSFYPKYYATFVSVVKNDNELK